jgi:hypothetical protein
MIYRQMKITLAIVGIGVLAGAPVVLAATDTEDNISPASQAVTASLKPATKASLKTTIGAITITVTCTKSSLTGTTPAKGLGPFPVGSPSFGGCTDTLGGTDTFKPSGSWKLRFVDAPNDETSTEPNSGDRLSLTIPKDGAKVTTSADPGCTVTVAPSAAVTVTGSYNDVKTLKFTSAKVPISIAGASCLVTGSGTSALSATYVLSPGIHDAS